MSEILIINGQVYEILNWEEFRRQVMFLLGETLMNAIQDEAIKQGLFQTGDYVRGFHWTVDNDGSLVIENDVPYAMHLEYGTFEFGLTYAPDSFPSSPLPKKKDLSMHQRASYPRGMQPFAVIRRVIYNDARMTKIITEAVGGGTIV